MRRKSFVVVAITLTFGGALAAVWLASRRLPRSRPIEAAAVVPVAPFAAAYEPPADDGYVGSSRCAPCHGEIAESFKLHPMAQSISTVAGAAETANLKSASASVVGRKRVYDVEWHAGGLRHHEKMFDAQGEIIYDQAVPMEYVVGSGRRAKAYLHRRGSLLFMSPLNWYARTNAWDLSPGYAPDDLRRFDRRITDECLGCHAGRVAPEGRMLNRYGDPAFTEMSVGCENCHGPGAGHVTQHESGAPVGDNADPIINPARLDIERRESICNQCHLQVAARVPRYGRSDLDFRPGQTFDDIWTAFDQASRKTADGRAPSVSHVQQMRASRCYSESQGRLGCTSCHDPHSVPLEDERRAFFRSRCLNCHDDASCRLALARRLEKGDSCTDCHMPRRASSNISHVAQTDHRVIKNVEVPAAGEAGADGDGLSFFDPANLRLESWERDRAQGLAAWKHRSKTGRPDTEKLSRVLVPLVDDVPDDGIVFNVVGALFSEDQMFERARHYFEAARQFPATEEAAVSGLLDIYYRVSDHEQALACADRLLEIDPGDARAHALRADLLASTGRVAEGIAAAQKALDFNPTLIPVRKWLVDAYRGAGREAERRAQEQIIRRIETARPPSRQARP